MRLNMRVKAGSSRHHRWALRILFFAVVSGPVRAADVAFFDQEFADADWELVVLHGQATASQQVSGGNPGAFRQIAFQADTTRTFHRRTGVTYDPALQGAIQSIDYSEDAVKLAGQWHNASLAIEQGGTVYRANTPVAVSWVSWQSFLLTNLQEQDWEGWNPVGNTWQVGLHPDFSATGDTIHFGFFRGKTGAGAGSVTGIDNWAVTIHRASFPDCNGNGIPDDEDIAGPTSEDVNGNLIPDECETAGEVEFFDGTFNDEDWELTVFGAGVGGTVSAYQETVGGNPGAYRRVENSLNGSGGSDRVIGFHRRIGAVYEPGNQGAILSIDFSEDARRFGPYRQHAGLAIQQDSRVYIPINHVVADQTVWTTLTATALNAVDFEGVVDGVGFDPSLRPDFSEQGAPIYFGFHRSNHILAGTGGIDNWHVVVHSSGPPPCPPGSGDFNADGDVDLNDFGTFAMCFSNGGTTPPADCPLPWFVACDLDCSGGVDLNDFATFAVNFTG